MRFIPNQEESKLLEQITNVNHQEYTLIRFTDTMLTKSIIDANMPIRKLFCDNFLVDYNNITPGEDKIILDGLLIKNDITDIKISCYRPKTKKGDPRFWIYNFKKYIRSGEMIYITIHNNKICIIPLVKSYFDINVISELFKSKDSPEVQECINLIKQFANKDILSVSPTKANPKDIGDTLERELNIPANSSKLADYKNLVELKAKRKSSKTKDTLFSMVPNWSDSTIQSSPEMILTFGYPSKKYIDFIDLYVTVSSTPNHQGLFLEVDEDNEILIQKHKDCNGIESTTCIWTFSDLKERLYSKHPETLWVIGDEIKKDGNIYFRYESIEHTCKPIFSSFLLLISQGKITFDWRGRVKKDGTSYKDKGHCFRLKPKFRNMLFGESENIIL